MKQEWSLSEIFNKMDKGIHMQLNDKSLLEVFNETNKENNKCN